MAAGKSLARLEGVEESMRAVVRDRYGSPEVLRLAEVARPVPVDDQVLVRVRAASVNTADLDYLKGFPPIVRLGTGVFRPRNKTLGLDVAGQVEAVGPNVTRFHPGDEVWADLFAFGQGGFAEYVCAPQRAFAPMPTGLSFEQAATVPHSGVLALQGLLGKGEIKPGEEVLINGAGGCVGPFAVQIAKSFGAEVTGVDHTEKLELLTSIGADHVIDYTREDFTETARRYDLILDIAAQGSLLRYRRSLKPRGRYVLVARSLAGFLQAMLVGAGISMTGSKKMGIFTWRPSRREDLDLLGRLIETGELEPVIDRHYQLSEVPAALHHVAEGRARGKVVITMGDR